MNVKNISYCTAQLIAIEAVRQYDAGIRIDSLNSSTDLAFQRLQRYLLREDARKEPSCFKLPRAIREIKIF